MIVIRTYKDRNTLFLPQRERYHFLGAMSQHVQQSTKQKQPRKSLFMPRQSSGTLKQSLKVCMGDGGESLQDQSHVAAAATKSLVGSTCATP